MSALPAESGDGWLAIEDAPKNGERIDLWIVFRDFSDPPIHGDLAYRVCDAWWEDGVGWVRKKLDGLQVGELRELEDGGQPHWNETRATHWRRRPADPPGWKPSNHPREEDWSRPDATLAQPGQAASK